MPQFNPALPVIHWRTSAPALPPRYASFARYLQRGIELNQFYFFLTIFCIDDRKNIGVLHCVGYIYFQPFGYMKIFFSYCWVCSFFPKRLMHIPLLRLICLIYCGWEKFLNHPRKEQPLTMVSTSLNVLKSSPKKSCLPQKFLEFCLDLGGNTALGFVRSTKFSAKK